MRRLVAVLLMTVCLSGVPVLAMGCGQPGAATPTQPAAAQAAAPTSAPAVVPTTAAAQGQPQATKAPAAAAQPSPAAASGTREVVDLTGRHVKIPTKIERVGTSFPATNQIIYMLGAGDKIVATVPSITQNEIFVKIYPRLKSIPAPFGTDVNLEVLLAAKPDVVFLMPTGEAVVQSIEKAGIPVLLVPGFTDPETLKEGVSFLGSILGEKESAVAKRFCDYYDANIKRVTSITSSIPRNQWVKAYYTASSPIETEGKGTLPAIWMEHGGAINVAGENGVQGSFVKVSMEDVLKWNPEAVVCRDPSVQRAILADDKWKTVQAVKGNRVYVNPRGVFVWGVRSAEEALQTLWSAKTFQPDRFKDLDMRAEIKEFYRNFHYYSPTDADVDLILNPTSP